jgi:drug/metabolite transporter (DMT)-like permease
MTSRRAPVLGVVFVVELGGTIAALILALVTREPLPTPEGLLFAVTAGAAGVIGILSLYHGLAVGRMGVVAPVAAVLGASVPVVVGMATEGVPKPAVLLGMAFGIAAVVLVSRIPVPAGGRSGLGFGLLAGLGIAGFNIAIGQLPDGEVFWALAALRIVAFPVIIAIVVIGRQPWRVPRPALWPAIGISLLDMGGNAFFIAATQAGALAIAVVVASLYPVVTVVLAIVILHERVTRSHAVGIGAAALAVALIASG